MSHILVQQWKTAKETFVMSEAKMSVGLKFRNRVYWVPAKGGKDKVLLNGAASFKASPVSAQRESYFRFPTIPWLGPFKYMVVCCELCCQVDHFIY